MPIPYRDRVNEAGGAILDAGLAPATAAYLLPCTYKEKIGKVLIYNECIYLPAWDNDFATKCLSVEIGFTGVTYLVAV